MLRTLYAFRILRAVRFLFLAPFILLALCGINWMTFHGDWWVRWAALGIGIAWLLSLFRVLRAVLVLGGVAALLAFLAQRRTKTS